MKRMSQQDLLRYLTNRQRRESNDDRSLPYGLNIPLKLVRKGLDLLCDNARLSNIVNKKVSAHVRGSFDPEEAFEGFIKPLLTGRPLTPEVALANFREFLRAEDILDEWQEYADYRHCMVAVLREVFTRRSSSDPDPDIPRVHPQRFPSSPFFTGRDAELARVAEVLTRDGILILSGIDGIGKTMLAEEYARRNRAKYLCRQMITSETTFSSFKDVILSVGIDGASIEPGDNENKILDRQMELLLNLDASCLLIFNNLDNEMEDYGLFQKILRESGAHILVTTRRRLLLPEGPELHVEPLSSEDQIRLLEESRRRAFACDEMIVAAEICSRVAGHTLLIQLLGRAMDNAALSPQDMLKRLDGIRGLPALNERVIVQKDDFNKSLEIRRYIGGLLFSLTSLPASEQRLLRFLTLAPLRGVPEVLLGARPFSINIHLLAGLENRGWVIRDAETKIVRLHPLVREAVLSELTVDSATCAPLLSELRQTLLEPNDAPLLTDRLRFAANVDDMLFISEDVRMLLTSEKMRSLLALTNENADSQAIWNECRKALRRELKSPELTPETPKRLELYDAYCEYRRIIEDAKPNGRVHGDALFMATASASDELDVTEPDEQVALARKRFMDLFAELRPYDGENAEDLTYATEAIDKEMSSYFEKTGNRGCWGWLCAEDRIAMLQSALNPEDIRALSALFELPGSDFLVATLETFERHQSVLPLIASGAVNTLTALFSLREDGNVGETT